MFYINIHYYYLYVYGHLSDLQKYNYNIHMGGEILKFDYLGGRESDLGYTIIKSYRPWAVGLQTNL